MELVIKLKAMGLLQQELLHTTNGREYVTRRALVDEAASLVAARHRVPLVRPDGSGLQRAFSRVNTPVRARVWKGGAVLPAARRACS